VTCPRRWRRRRALSATGFVSAGLGYAPRGGAVVRNVLGGLAAMVVAYATGLLVGAQI
jgi:VIT1/CCC1 family predicted Fe2+/Mn2+ transporter